MNILERFVSCLIPDYEDTEYPLDVEFNREGHKVISEHISTRQNTSYGTDSDLTFQSKLPQAKNIYPEPQGFNKQLTTPCVKLQVSSSQSEIIRDTKENDNYIPEPHQQVRIPDSLKHVKPTRAMLSLASMEDSYRLKFRLRQASIGTEPKISHVSTGRFKCLPDISRAVQDIRFRSEELHTKFSQSDMLYSQKESNYNPQEDVREKPELHPKISEEAPDCSVQSEKLHRQIEENCPQNQREAQWKTEQDIFYDKLQDDIDHLFQYQEWLNNWKGEGAGEKYFWPKTSPGQFEEMSGPSSSSLDNSSSNRLCKYILQVSYGCDSLIGVCGRISVAIPEVNTTFQKIIDVLPGVFDLFTKVDFLSTLCYKILTYAKQLVPTSRKLSRYSSGDYIKLSKLDLIVQKFRCSIRSLIEACQAMGVTCQDILDTAANNRHNVYLHKPHFEEVFKEMEEVFSTQIGIIGDLEVALELFEFASLHVQTTPKPMNIEQLKRGAKHRTVDTKHSETNRSKSHFERLSEELFSPTLQGRFTTIMNHVSSIRKRVLSLTIK